MLSSLKTALRALLRRTLVERELDEELRYHIERQTEQNIRSGMNPEEARREALKAFGGVGQAKERSRDARGVRWLEELWQDLRFGARMLLKRPGVTFVAALATALGICANTTIFSVVHSMIMRPFNFANQERLIAVWEGNTGDVNARGSVAPGNFADWREQNGACERLVAIEQRYFDLSDGDQPERFNGYRVTEGFFDMLGVKAAYGRTFLPEDSEPGHGRVVAISHKFWLRRFAGDPTVVGKALTLNGENFTVIGVMGPDFNYPYRGGEMWTPLVFDAKARHDRERHFLQVIGLLKPGVGIKQARADLGEIARHAERRFPETNTGRGVYVRSLKEDAVRGTAVAAPILIGASIFVLLISCANVANLLLARAATRRQEIAVRLALGASRRRIIRQLLTESVLLGAAGGALGLLLSVWSMGTLSHGIPEDFAQFIPGYERFGMSWTVFTFTLLTSLSAGALFGLAPAWHAARTDFNDALKGDGKGGSNTGAGRRLRGALVVAEVALSLTLLIGAGLLVRSFAETLRADLGVRPENVLALQVALPPDGYREENQRIDFFTRLLRDIEAMPDVADAGAVNIVPFSVMGANTVGVQIVGQPTFPKGRGPIVHHRVATPGYFKAIGTALRKGRLFTEQDDVRAAPVVLINETVARRFFAGRDPVGERLKFGDGKRDTAEIIGVVTDVKNEDLEEQADPTVYAPFAQQPWRQMNLIIHARQDPTPLASAARGSVRALDRGVPVSYVKTLRRMIDERLSPKRLMTLVIGVFAAAALLLAAVGIYAVISYVVAQRTREFGIRLALGAQSGAVLKLVIGQGLKLTLIGVALGLAGAFMLTRAMSFFLFGVTATDPLTFISVSLLQAAVALLACYLPARRATKVDPLIALKAE
jgi:putative ABC transport system permease protein